MQADKLIWYQNGQALYQSAEIHLYRSACQWISYRIQGLQFYQTCRNNIICVLKPGIFHAAFAHCVHLCHVYVCLYNCNLMNL